MKTKITLQEWFDILSFIDEDVDISVDGLDSIAYCPIELTEEGYKEFQLAFDKCYVTKDYPYTIMWDNDETDDEDGIPTCAYNAWDLISSMAGYCSDKDYKLWFKDIDYEKIK